VRLRYLYINAEGKTMARISDPSKNSEMDTTADPISQVVTSFFDDILKNVIKLS
jgi:hypothetical protein